MQCLVKHLSVLLERLQMGIAGISVSEAGDINGDGFDDTVLGTWQAAPSGRTLTGQVYVVSGKSFVTFLLELPSLNGGNLF